MTTRSLGSSQTDFLSMYETKLLIIKPWCSWTIWDLGKIIKLSSNCPLIVITFSSSTNCHHFVIKLSIGCQHFLNKLSSDCHDTVKKFSTLSLRRNRGQIDENLTNKLSTLCHQIVRRLPILSWRQWIDHRSWKLGLLIDICKIKHPFLSSS